MVAEHQGGKGKSGDIGCAAYPLDKRARYALCQVKLAVCESMQWRPQLARLAIYVSRYCSILMAACIIVRGQLINRNSFHCLFSKYT
eukprot:894113-Pelagomonas_calceolata.AAC.1